jgi:hypothetical protein
MGFKSMSKMKTTEPSVDEVGKGMKKGGKTKMAMGGGMPMGALSAAAAPAMGARPPMGRAMPSRKPDPRQAMIEAAMAQKAAQAPMMRKKGGMAKGGESKAETKSEMKMDKAQDKAMISKAFKQHDMQEHKGGKGTTLKLKHGGMKSYATGGVVQKYATGGVVQKYADGGHSKMSCSSGDGYKAMKKGGSF